jgi:hypothetical protein
MKAYFFECSKLFFIILCILLLSSCSAKISSIKSDKDEYLMISEGYLLLEISTNRNLEKILISGEKKIVLTRKELRAGSNYILTNLPAGDYQIEKVYTSAYFRFLFDEKIWSFHVEPNVISYIGTLEVRKSWFFSYFELINNSSLALEYLEEHFPNILGSRKIVYSGPGEDRFFDLVNDVKNLPIKEIN